MYAREINGDMHINVYTPCVLLGGGGGGGGCGSTYVGGLCAI